MGQKRKKQQLKQTIQNEKINQKALAKEGRLKIHRYRNKQDKQNRIFQNNERKFYQQVGGASTKSYQQLDKKEAKKKLEQNMRIERT